jgi:ribosomal protein S12 methylthiotransferase accessory factor
MITISFPGGVEVDAQIGGLTVRTDQAPPLGRGSAVSPFDLFLASIATCMGFYALRFCQERGLPTEGLGLAVEPVREPSGKRVVALRSVLTLPEGFPAKYEEAIRRAVDHCAVKRALTEPPSIELGIVRSEVGKEEPVEVG